MIGRDAKEEEMCQALLNAMKLSKTNRQIAEEYLDMDFQEEPELLKKVEPQNFNTAYFPGGKVPYLEWLEKKKRKEELGRYVRFIVEVGGSTAWRILVGPYIRQEMGADLNRLLSLYTGEHASEQKIAVLAGAFEAFSGSSLYDVKMLCQSEKENPEIFLRAMDYCRDCDGYKNAGKRSNAKLLLAAMYLHHMPVGTAPETVEYLQESMIAAIADVMAFEFQELKYIQNFARTAEKDTPFPQRILSIFSKRKESENSSSLLAGCAFLAVRHSVCFEIILRLMVAMDYRYQGRNKALNVCKGIVDEEWFQARMDEIEEMLPIQDDQYIRWSLKAGCKASVARMAVKRPEIIQAAATMTESETYEKLMEIIQNANPTLYEEMKTSYRETLRNKIISELLNHCYSGKVEAKKYLSGECPAETLAPYIEEWANGIYLDKERYQKIKHLKEIGDIPVYRRALVLEVLRRETGYFDALLYHGEQLEDVLQILEEEEIPIRMQAEALGGLCENINDKKKRAILFEQCVDIFAEKLQGQKDAEQWESGMEEAALKGNSAARVFCFMVLKKIEEGRYRDIYLSCVEDSTKEVRKVLLEICKEHREWKSEVLALLQSKKLKAREFAILVLEEWGDVSCLEEVNSALEREKNKKLAGLLQELAEELEAEKTEELEAEKTEGLEAERTELEAEKAREPEAEKTEELKAEKTEELEAEKTGEPEAEKAEELEAERTEEPKAEKAEGTETKGKEDPDEQRRLKQKEERLAAQIYKGNRKRKVEWVQSMSLPEVHRQEGEAVSKEYMLAILAAYADMEEAGISQDAVKLAAPLDSKEISLYMQSLYEEWKQSGAEARKRWVLYAVAIHGGAAMVPVLYAQIKEWAEHSRGAIAAEAVKALALNGSSEALILVDQMSRKFKHRQIKNAAGEAISDVASVLGIAHEELEDRLVPDMGFDEQMERTFDYGSRKFIVRLNPALEMEVYDGNGKRLKNLPSPGKQDDSDKAEQASEEFKQMKKQLKIVVQTQKLRLEQALSAARFWKITDWKNLFVKNPVMHQFAMGLVWGVYANGSLKETFRYMEDGSFNTADEKEYFLPENVEFASSGRELTGQESTTWQEPADQALDNLYKIGLVHPLELSKEELLSWQTQFADYEVIQPFDQLNRTVYLAAKEEEERYELERFDGKMLNGLSLSGKLLGMGWYRGGIMDAGFFASYYHNDGRMGAELTFSGSSVGYENEEVTVYNLYFYILTSGQICHRFKTPFARESGSLADVCNRQNKLPAAELQILSSNLFSEENRCKIKDVNPRYFSEIVLQIAKVVK